MSVGSQENEYDENTDPSPGIKRKSKLEGQSSDKAEVLKRLNKNNSGNTEGNSKNTKKERDDAPVKTEGFLKYNSCHLTTYVLINKY